MVRLVKMIRVDAGRFAEQPLFLSTGFRNECERLIWDLLLKRRGKLDYPVSTDDLTVLI